MKLLRSLSFRLALLYVGLFGLSVLLLGALYYAIAIRGPLEAVHSDLRSESDRFDALYRERGAAAVAQLLERRAGDLSSRAAYHALLDRAGNPLTTNLPSWPHAFAGDWIRIEADVAREGDEDEYEALVRDRRLPDGGRLLVGRDIEDLDELEDGLKGTLVWLLPALLLLSVAGAALMSRAIGRRIDHLTAAARGVIAGDLSERVSLRGTGDDFDRLGETLNLMLEQIEQALEAVRRVSDSVAHELRTPLTRLRASLAELERSGESRAVAEAVLEAERLQAIFNAILRISRIEASRPSEFAVPVDLSQLLHDAAELYQPEAEERGQEISLDVPPGLWLEGDRDLIFQAVANLLDNAVKFTPESGRISVTASTEDGRVRVVIEDNGPGIPPELREKVIERFFRAPNAGGVPGAGLGLSLVSAVAAYHRSSLRFEATDPGVRVVWEFAPATGRRLD